MEELLRELNRENSEMLRIRNEALPQVPPLEGMQGQGQGQGTMEELLRELNRENSEMLRIWNEALPQAPPPEGMQGQGQGQGQGQDQQAKISKKKKKNKSKKEKNELDLSVGEKNELDSPVKKNELDSPVEKNEDLPVDELHLSDYPRFKGHRKIGQLSLSAIELGIGFKGTKVYEGMWNGRKVAVKRIHNTGVEIASNEIRNYIASGQHTNVVTFYGVERDDNYYYLALELCTTTLQKRIAQDEDFQLWKDNYPSPKLIQLIRDMVHGLIHIHQRGILHLDLKPSNILILEECNNTCAKLSDLGISKCLEQNETIQTDTPPGSQWSRRWLAPELICKSSRTLTRAGDIFSLGCVIFFCISKGDCPFRDDTNKNDERVYMKNLEKNLEKIKEVPEAHDLVFSLLLPDPKERPRAENILYHPFFWDAETRLSFIRDASEYLKSKSTDGHAYFVWNELENVKEEVFTDKWLTILDPEFVYELSKPLPIGSKNKMYEFDSFGDLLGVIRDNWTHYNELPETVKQNVEHIPERYYHYFSSKFPKLLIVVYKIFRQHCKIVDPLKGYFKGV